MTDTKPTSLLHPSKLKQKSKLKDEHVVLVLFIAAGLSAYITDSAVDAFIFHDGLFLDVLMSTTPGELSMRLYILASFVILGIFVSRILVNRKKAEQALLESEQKFRSISMKLESLMKSSAVMLHTTDFRDRLATIAEAAREQGWKRSVITLKDENLDTVDIVTAGLTPKEEEYLKTHQPPGEIWGKRLSSMFERYRMGEFYYLPWSDPLVQEQFKHAISSKIPKEETVDWNPEDLLYIPLRLPDGQVVGIMSMDDPQNGRRPTKESLAPLELFAHQAAVAIENARLFQQLHSAKAQLQEHADHLEAKVAERTLELKEAQNRLLKSERLAAIGELAGMVGHDLRNPLTGIAGATYYLKKKYDTKMDDKGKEMLATVEKAIDYSNKIINDLLEYSREIKLELAESNPRAITEESLSLVEIPENIQVVDLAGNEPRIKVDVDRLKRAFVNIIKNAVDAMPKGGTLAVKSKEAGGNLEMTFSDTGMGMTKCMLEKIWSPLFTTKAKGMGFGLTICKRIVEAHRGKISVESTIVKGTTFTVTIPVDPKLEDEKVWADVPESLLSAARGTRVT